MGCARLNTYLGKVAMSSGSSPLPPAPLGMGMGMRMGMGRPRTRHYCCPKMANNCGKAEGIGPSRSFLVVGLVGPSLARAATAINQSIGPRHALGRVVRKHPGR